MNTNKMWLWTLSGIFSLNSGAPTSRSCDDLFGTSHKEAGNYCLWNAVIDSQWHLPSEQWGTNEPLLR